MTKPSLKAEFRSFVKGLVTETSELNSAPDSFQDALNFDINKDGSIQRRLGFQEDAGAATGLGLSATLAPLMAGEWVKPGGSETQEFVYFLFGSKVYIFDVMPTMSGATPVYVWNFGPYPLGQYFRVESVKGYLIATYGDVTYQVLKYDPTTNTFTPTIGKIKTRDVWGVPEGIYEDDILLSNNTLVPGHIYNLRNQGWGYPRRVGGAEEDPIQRYLTDLGRYPPNAESIWIGVQVDSGSANYSEAFYPDRYKELRGVSIKPPKGFFVIDAVQRGTSRSTEHVAFCAKYPSLANTAITFDTDTTTGGARFATEYAGRVVFGGFPGDVTGRTVRSPDLSDHLFFSQLINNEKDFEKCYSEGDPTSREAADLVETDGGFIRLSGAKTLIGAKQLGGTLIVIASNGVWSVMGGNDYGFSATNYRVEKLSTFGGYTANSIVSDGVNVFYWGPDGIFAVTPDQTGRPTVQSLSERSIQRLYNEIDESSKLAVCGTFDPLNKRVHWNYFDTVGKKISYELIFDVSIGAFTHRKIEAPVGAPERYIVAGISHPQFKYTYTMGGYTNRSQMKYAVVTNNGVTAPTVSFGGFTNTSYQDFGSVDARAYIVASETTNGDASMSKQLPWVTVFMRRTDTGQVEGSVENMSSCFMRGRWDWSSYETSGRWSTQQQVYRLPSFKALPPAGTPPEHRILFTKNKVRGMGKSFSIFMETEEGKHCAIVGWSVALNGNAIV